jgi:NADPH:quinone reductase-like Zn-dependent oxidoreductase
VVSVRAASLNHHDVCSARGLSIREDRLPMILGCDAAGVDADGDPVIVQSVIGGERWTGPEELDPELTLLSEAHEGTLAPGTDDGSDPQFRDAAEDGSG